MENGHVTRWFLGANSGVGFYSLYDSFAAENGDFLWVIKGGPGCGKSCFMKRIGTAAEEAGLDVEYIYCSGDPASLDGIYLPSRKTGWIDGTAPHTLDPKCFAATGAYLDLGIYCDMDSTQRIRKEISEFTKRYKELYARAYACLCAAASVASEKHAGLVSSEETAAVMRRASSVAARELPKAKKNTAYGKVTRRFLSSITCDGQIFLNDTLTTLCKHIYILDNRYGQAPQFIGELLSESRARGVDAILCLSPLDPTSPEALIIPSLSLGFLAVTQDTRPDFEANRHVRLDALVDPERARAMRPRIRADARIETELLDAASDALCGAKDLHDELEALFNPLIDFDALYAAAGREIARVIG
jgi:hypothetical protein